LYRIPLKDSKDSTEEHIVVFILLELKTKNERWTIFQILKYYIVRILEREYDRAEKQGCLRTFLLPMIIPIIFYYGKGSFTAPTDMTDLVRVLCGYKKYILNLRAFLFDVSLLESKDFPDDIELSIPLEILQAISRKDVTERLIQMHKKLQSTIHLPETKKEWDDAL
jgi:hypothetical protein